MPTYTPPLGSAADVELAQTSVYTPPVGSAADVELVETAGGGFVNGDFANYEAADTLTADGVLTPISVGDLNVTEQADTVIADGVLTPISFGTASITEAANTLTADGSVLVQGTFNKTEAANTLTADGHLVVGIPLSAVAGDGHTFMRKLHQAGGSCFYPAPYVYVDDGSPLGTLANMPLSTAVTVGQVYAFTYGGLAGDNYRWGYAEITQSGTTGSSQQQPSYSMGSEWTTGGAKWRMRFFHGWTKARWRGEIGMLPSYIGTNSPISLWPWTVVVASGHAQTYGCALKVGYDSSLTYYGMPGALVVSVNSAAFPPTTFAAGASFLATGDNVGALFTSPQYTGTIRGITAGHDNTTSSNYYDDFSGIGTPWSPSIRWIDCTFQTYRREGYGSNGSDEVQAVAGHSGARHSLRCAYKSLHASSPVAALSNNGGLTIVEAPTFTRLTSAATAVIRTTDQGSTFSAPIWPNPGTDVFVLAGDLSSFTGADTYTADSWRTSPTYPYYSGGSFRTFGTLLKSAGVASPAQWPLDMAWSAEGSTVETEYYPSVRTVPATEPQDTRGPVRPSTRRNSTYTRSGGASDALGSFSYVTTVDDYVQYPYAFEFYNTKIDESFLITIEFEWSSTGTGLTTLKDEDVWLEAAYLSNANTNEAELVFSFDKYNRRGLIYNDAVGPPALTTSGSTWAGALGSAVKQKVSIIVTPKKAGPIKVWLGMWLCPWTQNIATASSVTVYFDPLPVLSAAP